MPTVPTLAAILAGGRARRLGQPKATALLGGRPMIERPLAAAAAAGLETVVVAKAGSALPSLEVKVWHEPAEPVHPLSGVVHALRRARGRTIVAVGCDMPFVTAELLGELARPGAAAVVPRAGGRLHPLAAAYPASALPALEAALARRAPMQETVAALHPLILDESETTLFNVNTAEDLERAAAML